MGDLTSVLAGMTAVLAFALFLATVNERLVEKFLKPVLQKGGRESWTGQVALLSGLLMSVAFGIDLFTPAAEALGISLAVPWTGVLLTGLLVGGGSNFIHDVWPGTPEAVIGEVLEITTPDGETIEVEAAIEPLPVSRAGKRDGS